jgi:hypothetical protein
MPGNIYGFRLILRINYNIPLEGKLSLCLINYVLCHEDILGSGGIGPPFLTPALDGGEWSASRLGHFTHGGEETQVPIGEEAGLAPESLWTYRESNPGRTARSSSLYRLNYPVHGTNRLVSAMEMRCFGRN